MTPPPSFRIEHDHPRPGVHVVRVLGDIDLSTCPLLDEACADLSPETSCLVLDLTACGFIDSSGIAAVLRAQRAADAVGARLVVATSTARVLRTLEVTGAAASLVVVADADAALEAAGRV